MIELEYIEALKKVTPPPKWYEENQIIIEEGDNTTCSMYVVLTGSVGVYKNLKEPNEAFLATLSAGDFFGEMSLFLREPRSATVVAKERLLLLEIDRENALEVVKLHPELALSIKRVLCERIQESDDEDMEVI
jgi:CRP-like cAMP-binding protein